MRTPIVWETVSKVGNHSIICFGILETHLTAFTYNELADYIQYSKGFVNPLDGDQYPFPKLAIRKLKNLTKIIHPGETEDEVNARKKLARSIELGELFTKEINLKIKEFYLYCERLEPEDKANIYKLLIEFFHLAMLTRGWDPDNDERYPIEIALVANQNEVDIRVTQAIRSFELFCENLGDMGTKFLELPLVKYRGGWQHSNSATEGLTIGERLQILKHGDDHNHQNSCMRLTSNWFSASIYRYMTIVGLEPPFNIEKLRSIS